MIDSSMICLVDVVRMDISGMHDMVAGCSFHQQFPVLATFPGTSGDMGGPQSFRYHWPHGESMALKSQKTLKKNPHGLINPPFFLNHQGQSRFPHDSLQIRFFSTRFLGSLQMLPASTSLCGRKHSQDPVGIAECLFVVKLNKKVTGTSDGCLGCHYACFIQYYSSTKSQTN